LAAGRNKEISFLVASLFKIPFQDHQADFLLNAFAPASDLEFERVLKKDGLLVTVIPGREHLIELKSVLYDRPYENDEKEPELPSFKLEDQVRIKASIVINNHNDISDLVTMTPYYWRTPKEGLERLNKLDSLTITTEFIIGIHS
jgi:23S rRNA (guanine745-N1)-methyltransferase